MGSKPHLTFKGFMLSLYEESPLVTNYCEFIKDPQQKAACKKLYKKTRRNITYGGFFGRRGGGSSSGSGSGPGPGTGGGAGPGTGLGGGAFGGPGGAGGAFGSGGSGSGGGSGTGGGSGP